MGEVEALGMTFSQEAGNRFQSPEIVGSEVWPGCGWAWRLTGDLNHADYFSVRGHNGRRHELLNYLRVQSGVAWSLTSSKTLECLTCVKLLKSSALLVCAVTAATAELEKRDRSRRFQLRGIEEVKQSSAKLRSATSVLLTWKIFATQSQIDSGVLLADESKASCSMSPILPRMPEERASDKMTTVPFVTLLSTTEPHRQAFGSRGRCQSGGLTSAIAV